MRSKVRKLFQEHPNQVGETYWEHFCCATGMAREVLIIAIIMFIHACFPFLYQETASQRLEQLNQKIQQRKQCRKISK